MKKKMFLSIFVVVALCILSNNAFSQSYQSSQSHNGSVTSISETKTQDFFSSGADGFVIRWNSQGVGEHYQVSDMTISLMEASPVSNDVVICETNNVSTTSVSVFDWQNLNRRFTKRFKNTVTNLSYSAQGNYIIVGTASINGIYILNAKTGMVVKNVKGINGVITMARTGDSEKKVVMYSPSGYIYYYDMKNSKIIAKFSTEPALEQTTLFGNGKAADRFFAGVKDNTIYVIDATSGKTISIFNATNPFITSAKGDFEEGLYYVSSRGRGFSLSLIKQDALMKHIKAGSMQEIESVFVKNFQGLKSSDKFCSIAKNQESVFLGTVSGNIYTLSDIMESETYSLIPITQNNNQKILDICSNDDKFYFLTGSDIYNTSFSEKKVHKVTSVQNQTNMIMNGKNLILWSKDTKNPVVEVSASGIETKTLFTPKFKIQNLRSFGDKILYIEGNSYVNLYDLITGTSQQIYFGQAIEDAVIIGNEVYIAKSSISSDNEKDSPLVCVNIKTQETVTVKIEGTVVFSLSCSPNDNMLYGILMNNTNNDYETQVFSYNVNNKTYKSLMKTSEEDSTAFTTIYEKNLYTNIGKTQIYNYNTTSSRSTESFKRSSSVPVKVCASKNYLSSLNKDGSVSWYKSGTKQAIASWYLTNNNEWSEF